MKKIAQPLVILFIILEIVACISIIHYFVPYFLLKFGESLVGGDSDSLYLTSILWLAFSIILNLVIISALILINQKLEKFNFHFFNGILGGVIGLLIGAILFFFAPNMFSGIVWAFIFFVPMATGLNIGLRTN